MNFKHIMKRQNWMEINVKGTKVNRQSVFKMEMRWYLCLYESCQFPRLTYRMYIWQIFVSDIENIIRKIKPSCSKEIVLSTWVDGIQYGFSIPIIFSSTDSLYIAGLWGLSSESTSTSYLYEMDQSNNPQRSRKRTRNPIKHKSIINKRKVNEGEEYIKASGNIQRKRTFTAQYICQCRGALFKEYFCGEAETNLHYVLWST